jgi:hypothetical protein
MKLAQLFAVAAFAGLTTITSHAAPIFLDFEGIGNGAQIGEFYNGGTDSYGNRGFNYGISFIGGAFAQRNSEGMYLRGETFTIRFDSPIALTGNGTNSAFSYLYSAANDTLVPVIHTLPPIQDDFFLRATGTDRFVGIIQSASQPLTAATFQNVSLDNITFPGTVAPADRIRSTDIPEPSTLALIGAGVFGLIAARRKLKS